MALSATILRRLRQEIGDDVTAVGTDDDATLEVVYLDPGEGNYSVLVTALIVWRKRLFNLQARSHDVTTEGTLLSRNQRIRFMERRIKELELLADETQRGSNVPVLSQYQQAVAEGGEF